MKKPSDDNNNALRSKIVGLGSTSMHKSYYRDLQQRLTELERYSELLNQAHDAICLLTYPDLLFFEFNSSTLDLFKISQANIKNSSLLDYLDSSTKLEIKSWLDNPDQQPAKNVTDKHYKNNILASVIKMSLSKVSFNDTPYIVCIGHDITQQAKTEEQLHHVQKMEAIGQLTGGIAHDFNNMLGGILGTAELLSHKFKDNDQLTKYINLIKKTSIRAVDLTKKMLNFSRKENLIKSPIDIHLIIQETTQLLERSIDKIITIKSTFQANQSIINADSSLIQNTLLNLGLNARDAIQDSGEISYSTANTCFSKEFCEHSAFDLIPGEYIEIKVSDTGSGMPGKVMNHIFEPFYTTKGKSKGTGLGLASAYNTIIDHNGYIDVFSEENKGTVFKLYLPVHKRKSHSKVNVATAKHQSRNSGSILVVDDEEIMRSMTYEMLDDLGFKVKTAADGLEAINMFQSQPNHFDLVLLDMIMPRLGGLETLIELKHIKPTLKVLIISGFSHREKINKALEYEHVHFLKKPFVQKELSQAVEDILHQ